jgi:hypothetical protein
MAYYSVVIRTAEGGWIRPDSKEFETKVKDGHCSAPWPRPEYVLRAGPEFFERNGVPCAAIKHRDADSNDFEGAEVLWSSDGAGLAVKAPSLIDRLKAVTISIRTALTAYGPDAETMSGLYFARFDDPEAWFFMVVADTRYKMTVTCADAKAVEASKDYVARNERLAVWFTPEAIRDHFRGWSDDDTSKEWVNEVDDERLEVLAHECLADDALWETFASVVESHVYDSKPEEGH